MPLTLPVLWKFGKWLSPAPISCSIVILLTRIIISFLGFNSFPSCEAPLSLLVGKTIFRAKFLADKRENKASVRSESADGIPQFWRYEKICGRLPSSPPIENVSTTWHFSCPQYLCTIKLFRPRSSNGCRKHLLQTYPFKNITDGYSRCFHTS